MAAITLSAFTGTATINPFLSAFGPNQSGVYDNITIQTVQSPVTAFITAVSFLNPKPYENEPAIWTLLTNNLSAFPITVTSTGFGLGISGFTASVGAGSLGVQTAVLTLTLSSTCLSGAGLGSNTVVDTPIQTLSFPLTAVNLPYNNALCYDRFRRQWLQGI